MYLIVHQNKIMSKKCSIIIDPGPWIDLQGDKVTIRQNLDDKETSIQCLLSHLIQDCSTRSIKTIQVNWLELSHQTKCY